MAHDTEGSAVLYLHGGGMILGNIGLYDGVLARYVSNSGVPMLSVEYRYAPEYPGRTPVEDSYAGLSITPRSSARIRSELR
jgi:acetyl esterase/lipase